MQRRHSVSKSSVPWLVSRQKASQDSLQARSSVYSPCTDVPLPRNLSHHLNQHRSLANADYHEVLTFQPSQPLIPQPVLRQHSPHSAHKHLPASKLLSQLLQTDTLQTPRPSRMPIIQFLLRLLSRDVKCGAIGADDVIAAVG